MPDSFDGLGLDAEALNAHIAWDPGAVDVARQLSTALDAPLVEAGLSRLLIDCNRPLMRGILFLKSAKRRLFRATMNSAL